MDGAFTFWTGEFRRYSPLHALTALACVALIVGLCWWGARLRRRSETGERRLRLALALFAALTYIGATIFWALPGRFAS